MKMANLKDLEQADDAAQAVISLTKAIIGKDLSQKIAEVSPPDLRKGWESIEPSPVDYYERLGIYWAKPSWLELAYLRGEERRYRGMLGR